MDDSGYGSITIDEFEKLFEDEDMQALQQSHKLGEPTLQMNICLCTPSVNVLAC